MGASGLIQIKRRMKSIESTKKITKAMALVATSKLRKVRKSLKYSSDYYENIKNIFESAISELPEDFESIYLENKSNKKKLYIILTSDMGLCGGFNNNIALYINDNLKEDKENIEIVTIGTKGKTYLKKYKLSSTKEYGYLNDIPTKEEINDIYNYVISKYVKKEVSQINIVYTQFISPIRQNINEIKLLPIERKELKESGFLIEPKTEKIFDNIVDIYLKSQLLQFIISSKVSEHSSRRLAMESATDSADEILKTLNTKFNRIRQSIITQEISEIVGGAEAQK